MIKRKINVADLMWLPTVGLYVFVYMALKHGRWLRTHYEDGALFVLTVWQVFWFAQLLAWLHPYLVR